MEHETEREYEQGWEQGHDREPCPAGERGRPSKPTARGGPGEGGRPGAPPYPGGPGERGRLGKPGRYAPPWIRPHMHPMQRLLWELAAAKLVGRKMIAAYGPVGGGLRTMPQYEFGAEYTGVLLASGCVSMPYVPGYGYRRLPLWPRIVGVENVDIVSGLPLTMRWSCLRDLNPVFRVLETIALRVKRPSAIVVLRQK